VTRRSDSEMMAVEMMHRQRGFRQWRWRGRLRTRAVGAGARGGERSAAFGPSGRDAGL
jgi:hypothetical protein